jgi:transcriptional regulator with XRE-family HTH domain
MTKFSRANWLPRQLEDNLLIVGEQFRLARLRRNLTIEQVAERAQCSRLTVAKLEKGLPTVSLGVVLRVLYALQLDTDILMLAKDDALGRDIQDIELKNRKRASKKS